MFATFKQQAAAAHRKETVFLEIVVSNVLEKKNPRPPDIITIGIMIIISTYFIDLGSVWSKSSNCFTPVQPTVFPTAST